MKKIDKTTFLLILILVTGLSLLLYPTVAEWWNSFHSTQAMVSYDEVVSQIDNDEYKQIWDSAVQYNDDLRKRSNIFSLSDSMRERYQSNLDVNNTGAMGYIIIPKIDVHLPIYHGTDDAVLQVAVGHLDWTSLPVGGESSHAVFSGHRGLPSAKLFTDLDDLVVGDRMEFKILDETLTYEVDQIKVVEPEVIDDLVIVEGQDLVTLVTCTPYGINSHRLLVRGHRVDTEPIIVERRVTADALYVDPMVVAGALLGPCVLLGVAGIFVVDGILTRSRKRKK